MSGYSVRGQLQSDQPCRIDCVLAGFKSHYYEFLNNVYTCVIAE